MRDLPIIVLICRFSVRRKKCLRGVWFTFCNAAGGGGGGGGGSSCFSHNFWTRRRRRWHSCRCPKCVEHDNTVHRRVVMLPLQPHVHAWFKAPCYGNKFGICLVMTKRALSVSLLLAAPKHVCTLIIGCKLISNYIIQGLYFLE